MTGQMTPAEMAGELARARSVSMRHYGYATAGGSPYGKHGPIQARWWMESSVRYAAIALRLAQECRARKGEPEMAKWLDIYGISL